LFLLPGLLLLSLRLHPHPTVVLAQHSLLIVYRVFLPIIYPGLLYFRQVVLIFGCRRSLNYGG
jgi:hypothetical protein